MPTYFVRKLNNIHDVCAAVKQAKKCFAHTALTEAISKLVKENPNWENQIYFQVYCK